MKTAKQLAPLLAAIVVLLAAFRIWVPQFLALDNLLDLAQQISVNAMLAFGMTLVILIGGIDLSVGAVVALIGTLTVWLLPQVGLVGGGLRGPGGGRRLRRDQRGLRGQDRHAAVHHHPGHDAASRGALAFRFNEGRPISMPDEPGGVPRARATGGSSGSCPCRCW